MDVNLETYKLEPCNCPAACVEFGAASMRPYYEHYQLNCDRAHRESLYADFEIYQLKGDSVVAYLVLRETKSKFYVADIQVAAGLQNRGLGSALLKWAENTAVQKAYKEIYLKVFKISPAQSLYQRLGYGIETQDDCTFLLRKSLC